MIRLDCKQGGPEWDEARLGIPTASNFDRILTPTKLEYSRRSEDYRDELLAEWLLGFPLDQFSTSEMDRGTRLERTARAWYELSHADVEEVGFVLRDDRQVGGSPDGFVGDDGLVEIKCPMAKAHIGYLLDDGTPHRGQIQGLLYLTGREWCDLVVYSDYLPKLVRRFERDEDYIEALEKALWRFLQDLNECKDKLRVHAPEKPEPAPLAWLG